MILKRSRIYYLNVHAYVIVVHKDVKRTPSSILTLLRLTLFRVIELFVPKNGEIRSSLLREITDKSNEIVFILKVDQINLIICFISLDHKDRTFKRTAI